MALPRSRPTDKGRKSRPNDFSRALEICESANQPLANRFEQILLLGEYRSREAVPALVRLLDEGPDEIRLASTDALKDIGSRVATKPLCRILKRHPSLLARELASIILFTLADRRAEKVLGQVLKNKGETEYLRGRAAQALGMLHPQNKSVPMLIGGLSDPSTEVRFSSICALSFTHGRRVSTSVITALERLTKDSAVLPNEGSVGEKATVVLGALQSWMKEFQSTRRKSQGRNEAG